MRPDWDSRTQLPMPDEERYSRQVLFKGIGAEGQKRLGAAKVAIVGCGATGSTIASLLGRAGVGTIRIIDRDYVEFSNLHRQTLFDEADASLLLPKAVAASRKLVAFNSQVVVEPVVADLTPANVEGLLTGLELILDGTDNFETRYLINDFAVKCGTAWIYTAAVGSTAASMNILPGQTACLTCVFPDRPTGTIETCETEGVLNSAVAMAASIAATEATKLLVGATDRLRRTLVWFDIWRNERAEVAASNPREHCQTCAVRDFIHLRGVQRPQITLCGRNSVQIHERNRPVNLAEISSRLTPHGTVRHTEFILRFHRDPYEMTLFPDGRAIIKGTTDKAAARNFYAQWVGS